MKINVFHSLLFPVSSGHALPNSSSRGRPFAIQETRETANTLATSCSHYVTFIIWEVRLKSRNASLRKRYDRSVYRDVQYTRR